MWGTWIWTALGGVLLFLFAIALLASPGGPIFAVLIGAALIVVAIVALSARRGAKEQSQTGSVSEQTTGTTEESIANPRKPQSGGAPRSGEGAPSA